MASAFHIPIPLVIRRSLDILSGLALPTALLLIGAALSLRVLRGRLSTVIGAVGLKLFLLPAVGLLLFRGFQVPATDYLPGLILLASISASTLISAASFSFWLAVAGRMS